MVLVTYKGVLASLIVFALAGLGCDNPTPDPPTSQVVDNSSQAPSVQQESPKPPIVKPLTAEEKRAEAKKQHAEQLAEKRAAKEEEANRIKQEKEEAAEAAAAARQTDLDAYARIKAKAAQDWPDDYSEQKFVYDEQVAAYEYMKTIPDSSLKEKVVSDWPDDYTEQKFVYDENMKAKASLDSSP